MEIEIEKRKSSEGKLNENFVQKELVRCDVQVRDVKEMMRVITSLATYPESFVPSASGVDER